LRSLVGWHPGQRARAWIRAFGLDSRIAGALGWHNYATVLAKLQDLEYGDPPIDRRVLFASLENSGELAIEVPADFDYDKARTDRRKKLEEVKKIADQHSRRLENEDFQTKASDETRRETVENFVRLKNQMRHLEKEIQRLERN
jgi:valyl-tRNA synthetase